MDLEVIELCPRSEAERDAMTALLDLGQLIDESPIAIEDTRLIGGQMVDLHVARRKLGARYERMTADTDFGLDIRSLRSLEAVARFEGYDYRLRDGHRFYRKLDPDPESTREAIIDVLIPNYTSKPGKPKHVGEISSYQTPGLAELLRFDPVVLELHVAFDHETRSAVVAVPDERGALFIKAAAWDDRSRKESADKDAFDVWRCLELCHAVGVRPPDWPDAYAGGLRQILSRDFREPDSSGLRALARFVPGDGAQAVTRTIALCSRVVGPSVRQRPTRCV